MTSLSQIARSWFKFIEGDAYTKLLMARRLAICDTCEHKKEINSLGRLLIQAINDEASTFQCGRCGCPLAGKTAEPMNECPLGKWKNTGEQSYFN